MSVTIEYEGEEILSLDSDAEEALATAGTYCRGDFKIKNIQKGGPFEWKGEYDESTTYSKNDVVEHDGSCWLFVNSTPSTASAPGTDTKWQLMVEKGENGYTPVKGTDYFTDEDKQELVEDVLTAMPLWLGGFF